MNGNAVVAAIVSALVWACIISSSEGVLLRKSAAPPAVLAATSAPPAAKVQTKAAVPTAPKKVSGTHAPAAARKAPAKVVAKPDPLEAELKHAKALVQSKEAQLKVQVSLEKEKEHTAAQAQNVTNMLRKRVDKLRKEADVAAEIAREKSKVAAKVEKLRNASDLKAEHLVSEEKEIQRVLNQTNQEEVALEHNVSMIEQMIKVESEAKAKKTRATTKATVLLPVAPANVKSGKVQDGVAASSVAQIPKPAVQTAKFVNATVEGNSSAAVEANATAMPTSEDVKRLMEENQRLKREKAALERKLNMKKVAIEKAKLKQKLKNRLALADRHNKLIKAKRH